MKKWVLIGLMVLSTRIALAESVVVQGGWLHTPNSNYGDSGIVGVRAEHDINEYLGVGLDYSYHGETSVFPEDAPEYGGFDGHAVIAGVSIYPIQAKIRPYLFLGAGWSWWDFHESDDTKSRGISVDAGDSFCVKYAIGADWKLDSHWSLNIEWSYFETDIEKNANYADGSFSNILDTGDTLGHGETNVVVGVRYRW